MSKFSSNLKPYIKIKNIHMFEQIKHNMNIAGVAIYPNMSLLIFFIFFVGLGFGSSLIKRKD
jgi:Na+/H+ antiporter NhaC